MRKVNNNLIDCLINLMIFVQQHLLRKTKRSNVKVMFLNFIKIIRMELGIKLSNHITIKSILNSLKNIYILILFSSGSWMLSVKSITFTWLQPFHYTKWVRLMLKVALNTITLNNQFISIHTSPSSTVMIMCSIRQLLFVSRDRTRNGSFCSSMWYG